MKTTKGIMLACAATALATVTLHGNPVWTGSSGSDWWNAENWKWWPEGYDAGNVPAVIPEPVFQDDAGGSSTVDLNGRRAEASGAVWVRRCDREMILWNGAVAMDSDLNLRSTEGEGAVTKGPALRLMKLDISVNGSVNIGGDWRHDGIGTLFVEDGTVLNARDLRMAIGSGERSYYVQNGGDARFHWFCCASRTQGGEGSIELNGGVLKVPGFEISGSGSDPYSVATTLHLNGGVLMPHPNNYGWVSGEIVPPWLPTVIGRAGAKIDTAWRDVRIASNSLTADVNDGGLTKLGGGTLAVVRGVVWRGPTKVMSGTLDLCGHSDWLPWESKLVLGGGKVANLGPNARFSDVTVEDGEYESSEVFCADGGTVHLKGGVLTVPKDAPYHVSVSGGSLVVSGFAPAEQVSLPACVEFPQEASGGRFDVCFAERTEVISVSVDGDGRVSGTTQGATSPKYVNGEFYGNPILDHRFTADPTSVEHNGRLYVYATNDHQQFEESAAGTGNSYEKIKTITMMSTADMVNWTYHGEIDVAAIAPWIIASWAPSVVSRVEADGQTHFYMYFSNSGAGTGVLTATSPVGPWTSPLSGPLVDQSSWFTRGCKVPFDPGAAIAPDGTGYLTFGGGGDARIVRLGADLVSVSGEASVLPAQFHFEANELNFIGNKCVYTYNVDWTGHDGWDAQCAAPSSCSMVYMMSGDPMNESSWTVRGEYNANPMYFGCMPCNNHTHLQKFKGRWYLIYHNQELQKDLVHATRGMRNINIDLCKVDEDTVTISPVENTRRGVEQVESLNPYGRLQAETAAATSGVRFVPLAAPGDMAARAKTGRGWIALRGADFGPTSPELLTFRARGGGRIEVHLDAPDGPLVTVCYVGGGSEFETATSSNWSWATGVHDVFVVLDGSVELDWWTFGGFSRSAAEFVKDISLGINIGNTLDCPTANELDWGCQRVTKSLFRLYREKGINAVRVPVTWKNQFRRDDPEHRISKAFLDRVQDVVDMCLAEGMIAILNTHHDSGGAGWPDEWLAVDGANEDAANAVLADVWRQIATRFRDYGERLVFEGFNEVRKAIAYSGYDGQQSGMDDWSGKPLYCEAVNRYAKTFYDTVRATGGNNASRYLLIATYAATDYEPSCLAWRHPSPGDDHVMVSIHAYEPGSFCLRGNDPEYREQDFADCFERVFGMLKRVFSDKGVPVIIGEVNADMRFYDDAKTIPNDADRVNWARHYAREAARYGFPCFLWDNGYDRGMGLVNRRDVEWSHPEIVDAFNEGRSVGKGLPIPTAQCVTMTTAAPVPYQWLEPYVLKYGGGDYETAGNASGANGGALWESYVAGLDPDDPDSRLLAMIEMKADGSPEVSWDPDLRNADPPRKYTVLGKQSLDDASWTVVTEENLDQMKFFKVVAEIDSSRLSYCRVIPRNGAQMIQYKRKTYLSERNVI